jgi:hypothetical protein
VAWVGRWKFLDGWTKVWSCGRHADELVGARRGSGTNPVGPDVERAIRPYGIDQCEATLNNSDPVQKWRAGHELKGTKMSIS